MKQIERIFVNELKFRFENKQLLEINLDKEIVLLNPDKILFAKIEEKSL